MCGSGGRVDVSSNMDGKYEKKIESGPETVEK
jgi:hypothetical protein